MSDAHASSGGLPLKHLTDGLLHKIHSNGTHLHPKPFIIAFIVSLVVFLFISPEQTLRNFGFVGFFAPLWMPIFLYEFTFYQFVESRKAEFIANQKTVLLELRMPRDTQKTPLAMELIFANLHQGPGEGTWYNRIWLGKVRPWWSFEMVSLGGRVHFYVWTREGFRRSLESYFYGQYPNMEIIEAEDYSLLFDPASHDNDMFGDEFTHTKEDPYPIKTYVDYGLDKAGIKPEEQIDPLSQVIELLGSLGPKEQMWLQFIIRTSKGESRAPKASGASHTPEGYQLKDEAKDIITKIRESTVKKSKYVDAAGKVVETDGFPNPTKGQSDTINAIEKNLAKQIFDVGIRAVYTAPKTDYKGFMIGPLLSIFKPFSSEAYNGFKPAGTFSAKFEDYPWEDPTGSHHEHSNHRFVEFFRRRAFYHAPYKGPWNVMSTEELATIFHVPSAGITTPNLPRIQSTTSGAPANLPT